MAGEPGVLLQLEGVARVYPRDVGDTHSSVMREMLLPLRSLANCPPTHFHALRDIGLSLAQGQQVGVLGTHRSGKSTLAAIASGLMRPTSGTVTARASRSLLARPTAGFKPGLTVVDNLSFRAMLHGLTGAALEAAVERTLSLCGLGHEQAHRAIGNLSPYVAKQLGLTLLLQVPSEVLVLDEFTAAGTGDARWEVQARLQERIAAATALVIAGDARFVREVADTAWLLHQARLYGPFPIEQAIEAFEELPPEGTADAVTDEAYDPMVPPRVQTGTAGVVSSDGYDYDSEQDEGSAVHSEEDAVDPPVRVKPPARPWKAASVFVDGEEFQQAQLSLIRRPGAPVQVTAELASLLEQEFTGGMFALQGGSSGTEIARLPFPHEAMTVAAGDRMTLRFEFLVPDWGEDFYGLSFCPQTRGKHFNPAHRIKIVIIGVGRKHEVRPDRTLAIRNSSFERKLDNASVDTLPRSAEGQQATGQVVGEVQAPA